MNLDAFGLTNLFDIFSCTLYVGDHNCNVPVVTVVVVCLAAAVVVLLIRLVVPVELVLQLV